MRFFSKLFCIVGFSATVACGSGSITQSSEALSTETDPQGAAANAVVVQALNPFWFMSTEFVGIFTLDSGENVRFRAIVSPNLPGLTFEYRIDEQDMRTVDLRANGACLRTPEAMTCTYQWSDPVGTAPKIVLTFKKDVAKPLPGIEQLEWLGEMLVPAKLIYIARDLGDAGSGCDLSSMNGCPL